MSARILVVEDDNSLRRLTVDLLRGEGYRVDASATLEDGWASIQAAKPDLVVLDLQFAKGTGLDLCRRVKATPGTRDCLVIFLTARGAAENVVAARLLSDGLATVGREVRAIAGHQLGQDSHRRFQTQSAQRGASTGPSPVDRAKCGTAIHLATDERAMSSPRSGARMATTKSNNDFIGDKIRRLFLLLDEVALWRQILSAA